MFEELIKTMKLGWPIIIGNMTQMSLGFIDNAMVGKIHSSQIAAASLVNSVLGFPMVLGIGFTMAISVLAAEAVGQEKWDKPLRTAFNGMMVSAGIITLFAFLISWNSGLVFHLKQDDIVATLAQPYLEWMAWGMIPMVMFLALKHFSDGVGNTTIPLYISLLVLPLNIGLNYIFIYGYFGVPRMELEGAGIGTLISRITVVAILGLYILFHKKFEIYRQHLSQQLRYERTEMLGVIKLGVPSALQFGMEVAAFAFTGIMTGWLGYIQQSAHQIALQISAMAFMVSIGISVAGTIRISYHWGIQAFERCKSIGKSTLILATAYGVIMGILFIIFRDELPLIFNDETEVLYWASLLMICSAVFQVSDSVQAVAIGLLRGIQDVNTPTFFVFLSYWIIGIPTGYILAFEMDQGIIGLWIGLIIGLTVSAILNTWRFWSRMKNANDA